MIRNTTVRQDEITTSLEGSVTATRILRVTTDGNESVYSLGAHTGLPMLGDNYQTIGTGTPLTSDFLFLVSKTPRKVERAKGKVFDVRLEYAEIPAMAYAGGTLPDFGFVPPGYTLPTPENPLIPYYENPVDRPPTVDWSFVEYEYHTGKDINAKEYKNTIDMPLRDPPPTVLTMMVANVRFNVASYDPTFYEAFNNSINESAWLSFAAGRCKLNISPGPMTSENGFTSYPILYQVSVHPITWHPTEVLNIGDMVRDGASLSDPIIVPRDANGVLLSGPFLLDDMGQRTDTPHYLVFQQYRIQEWGLLGFTGIDDEVGV